MEVSLPVVRKSGQSLIELLAALAVILIVLLALAGVGMVSVKNTTLSRQKALATKYAQEGMEKVRSYRDINGWALFLTNCGNLTELNLPVLPAPYMRTVACVDGGGGKRTVTMRVYWVDTKGITHESKLISNFTDQLTW